MSRFILTVAASTAVLVLLLGAVGFVAARSILGAHAADAAALAPPGNPGRVARPMPRRRSPATRSS